MKGIIFKSIALCFCEAAELKIFRVCVIMLSEGFWIAKELKNDDAVAPSME